MRSSSRVQCTLASEYSLVKEQILIQNERILQLYVIQSKYDPFLWYGLLFVDTGIYMGAVIRFNMVIPSSYPDSNCPKVYLDPIPYHPLIDPDTGELDTKNAFPDWNSTTYKLHQLLSFVKRIIHQPNIYFDQISALLDKHRIQRSTSHKEPPNDTKEFLVDQDLNQDHDEQNSKVLDMQRTKINEYSSDVIDLFTRFNHTLECIELYRNDQDEFKRLTNKFKQKCFNQLYDKPSSIHGDDDNVLTLKPWDSNLHEITRECILTGKFAPTKFFASYHKDSDRVSFLPSPDSA